MNLMEEIKRKFRHSSNLARKIDVSPELVQQWARGKTTVSNRKALAVAVALECKVIDLVPYMNKNDSELVRRAWFEGVEYGCIVVAMMMDEQEGKQNENSNAD